MRIAVALALALVLAPAARAGGGPERTVVVVNADSPVSLQVAHEYARRRAIPPSHLIYLEGVPTLRVVDLATYRERLWNPVKAALVERGLLETTDLLAWSADFPFGVDVGEEAKAKKVEGLQHVPFRAALTGLTWFWRHVEAQDPARYLDLRGNAYFHRDATETSAGTSHGFSPGRLWNPDGTPQRGLWAYGEHPRDCYLLSVMLGYTGEWGNSAPEVLDCLARGIASDGTQPDGTVYLLANDDVRADTREPFFPLTKSVLESLGRKVQVLTKGEDGQDGIVPKGKADVIGAVLGAAGLTWAGSGSTLLPGAIAEHLTSFGADFSHGGQTKLSELIRAGAAGSSGTVAEPLALWPKFPLPTIHAHYARGCSLAEACYQSLASPWQTLVVGDPLARPFARFATVAFTAPVGEAAVSGALEVRAQITEPSNARWELWVDGRLVQQAAQGEPLPWDTTKEDDGVHEVRVVHVASDDIETRSHAIRMLTVANAGRAVTCQRPKEAPRYGTKAVFTGKAAEATEVDLLLGARVLASVPVKAGAFRLEVDTLTLGPAPVTLVARARYAAGPAARSAPLAFAVAAPADKPPAKPTKPKKPKDAKAPVAGSTGLRLVATDEKKKVHEGLLAALTDEALTKALADLKVPQPKTLTLEGEIQVAADGFYQLILATTGSVTVEWAGQRALETADAGPARLAFAAAHLKAGWNPIRITLTPPSAPRLSALLGGQVVTAPVAPAALRH